MVLESLGVPFEILNNYLQEFIKNIKFENVIKDVEEGDFKTLGGYEDGMNDVMKTIFFKIKAKNFSFGSESFIKNSMFYFQTKLIEQLQNKIKIDVPESANLIGVVDDKGKLQGLITIKDIAKPVRSLAELDAKANNIRLTWDLPGDLPEVEADPVQIQQIILNLIRNAVDAMHDTEPDRRDIRISAKLTGPHEIRLDVSLGSRNNR